MAIRTILTAFSIHTFLDHLTRKKVTCKDSLIKTLLNFFRFSNQVDKLKQVRVVPENLPPNSYMFAVKNAKLF